MSDKKQKQEPARMLAHVIGRRLSEDELDAVSGGSWTTSVDGNNRRDSADDSLN